MASPVIKIKRSSVQNNAPTAAQLELGELALNTYDGKLFTEINDGTVSIVEIGGHLNHLAATGVSTFGTGSTAVVVGGATTSLLVRGDCRVVGVLTVGSGSITLDESTDTINVGSATTITTTGFQIGGNGVFVHSTGYNVGNTFVHNAGITGAGANLSGIITAVGLDISGNFNIPNDSGKIRLGASNDLEIFHTGTASKINNATGSLLIQSDAMSFHGDGGSETMATFAKNGAVELYYDNVKHFETSSAGLNFCGSNVDQMQWQKSNNLLKFRDGTKAIFGEGDDLEIFSDGSTCFLKSDDLRLRSKTGNENYLTFVANGAVTAFYDNSKKFETASYGVAISGLLDVNGGGINVDDNQKIKIGASDDLQIFHDGSHSYVKDDGTGDLVLQTQGGHVHIKYGSDTMAKFQPSGWAQLYFNNSKKFETTSIGVNVTGHSELDNLKSVGIATFTNNAIHANVYSTGISTISGFRFPTSDGDEDQALVTDGNGALSFKTLSGGGGATGAATTISAGIVTATQGQTVFSTPHPHNDGTSTYSAQVFVNGVKQRPQGAGNATKDFTTSSNSTITFEEGLTVGDQVFAVVYFGHTIEEEYFTSTQGQVLFPLTGSLSAQKNFRVFVNGVKQRVGSDFGVAAPVTLVQACAEGAHVEIVCDNAEDVFVATDQQTNFTPTSTDISEDNMQVYVNGIQVFKGLDYSIGSPSVTLTDATGLTVGDEVDVCIRRA